MSYSKPVNPKRKRRVYATKEPPFPVPIATITSEAPSPNQWFYYTGYLFGDHIVVKHSGDIDFLYKMGFFGKGTLSRSKPEFNKRYRYVEVLDGEGDTVTARVFSRRRYLRRLHWTGKVTEEQYDSSQEDEVEARGDVNDVNCSESEPKRHESFSDKMKGEKAGIEENSFQETSQMYIDNTTENEEWYTFSEVKEENTNPGDAWDTAEGDTDFWSNDTNLTKDKTESDWMITSAPNQKDTSEWSTTVDQTKHSNCDTVKTFQEHKMCQSDLDVAKESFSLINNDKKQNSISNDAVNKSETDTEDHEDEEVYEDRNESSKQIETKHNQSMEECVHQTKEDESDQCDPLSLQNEEDGTLFIVDDSDSESETKKRKYSELPWRPVTKQDPFFVQEDLHLSFEEAFFLAYGLGSLIVYNESKEKLLLVDLWRIFTQRRPNFLSKYLAYHYYRSKGWVPKSGLKFGADLIIYKEGPAFYHSSFSVIVRMIDMDTLQENTQQYEKRKFTWTQLSGLNRVTEHVGKEIVICNIMKPSSLSEEDLASPKCIPLFKIQEQVVSRWVSSQERENKQIQDIP